MLTREKDEVGPATSPRVLLIAATTGYQTRAFGEAAARLGVTLVFATDRCHQLDDPWRDSAVPVRFHDERAFLASLDEMARQGALDGVLGVGDRPALFAALAAEHFGLRGHPPAAARASGNKLAARRSLTAAGLPVPWFLEAPLDGGAGERLNALSYPCVVKPLALSGSRGVIRADDATALRAALARVRGLLARGDIRERRDPADARVIIEQYLPGREYAVEACMEDGEFRMLALFDKPDPLEGPFFEETIYVTPSAAPCGVQRQIEEAIGAAAQALGLRQGPVHAECRVNRDGVFVLEAAARPIGGLCARVLRFRDRGGALVTFEELLLRHALGLPTEDCDREPHAAAVMMIPIPRAGMYRRTDNLDAARAVPGVVDLVVTAKPDQRIEPLPEGGSYLGFIFARAAEPGDAVRALREAHATLHVVIDAPIPVM